MEIIVSGWTEGSLIRAVFVDGSKDCFPVGQKSVMVSGCKVRLHVRCNFSTTHTPGLAFRHLPPNSARTGYATKGALFISARIGYATKGALFISAYLSMHWRSQRPPKGLGTVERAWCRSTHVKREARAPRIKKKKKKQKKRVRLDLNDFGCIYDGVSNMDGYERNAWYNLSCLLKTYYSLNTNEKRSVRWQLLETYGVTVIG